jgi:GTP-binding protein
MRDRRPAATARDGAGPPEERSLKFVGSFLRADGSLDPPLPEIALVGRSNVGKSSLLNGLAGRKIAKVSTTPGKTRAMNVYLLSAPCSFYVLDLPGYGYARASKGERAAFRRLVASVLHRPRLAGVLWLLDIRRDPSDEDRDMHDQFAAAATRILAAITKSDKLPRGLTQRRERELGAALQLDEDQAIVTSARTGEGVAELRDAIEALVRDA